MAGLGFLPLLVMPADTLRLCLARTMLSVVAGLLADRACERMAQIGVTVLGLDDSARQRWAVALRKLPIEQAQAVAATSGLSPQRNGEIAAEHAPASPAEQDAIAAALERPPRELFTDIPPARAA